MKYYNSFLVVLLLMLASLAANAQNSPRGDVNGDGEVNIADVNVVIDVILGGGSNTAADVNNDAEINIADINALIDIILGGGAPAPDEHEYVDLGLPSGTLWATCNIGASSPEDYGYYFAWGETEPKEFCDAFNYKWFNVIDSTHFELTKYCTDSNYGTVDGKTELDPEDDAAYVNWGSSWCMPTKEQINELISTCRAEWTTQNGVNGRLFTGPNGNTIFFPAAGYNWEEVTLAGEFGYYWTKTLYTDDEREIGPVLAHYFQFHRGSYGGLAAMRLSELYRLCGLTVRPVCASQDSSAIDHEYVDLGLPSGTLWATCNIGASSPEDYGYYFAWGETEPKEFCDAFNYKWFNVIDSTHFELTKYCTDSNYGTVDGKTELDPEDDAAYVNWGSSWCMPTKEQINELISTCRAEWTTQNGVNGRLFTGPNGNTIFFPAAGYNWEEVTLAGTYGYYWTKTLYTDDEREIGPVLAHNFEFHQVSYGGAAAMRLSEHYRLCGLTVRPVRASQD